MANVEASGGYWIEEADLREMNVPPESYLRKLYGGVVEEFECIEVHEVTDESGAFPFEPLA